MSDRPDATELLAQARQVLVEEIARELSGEAKFKALMVANAMAIAQRELSGSVAIDEAKSVLRQKYRIDGKVLKSSLRAGRYDGAVMLHQYLIELTRARLLISNPKVLARKEKT